MVTSRPTVTVVVMFARIALLIGVLCVPVLLALASQALAESTEPPRMPEPATTAVAEVPAGLPAQAGPGAQDPAGPAAGGSPAVGPQPGGPQPVQIEPRPVGTPADLDGDRDDDGIADGEDTDDTGPDDSDDGQDDDGTDR